jgi:hypothetical protein
MDISSQPTPATKWKQCEHLFGPDRRCGSPAMRGYHFCYFHRQNRRLRGRQIIPDLTNPLHIQRALSNVLRAIVSGNVTYEEAGRILHGINLAMQTMRSSLPRERTPRRPFKL